MKRIYTYGGSLEKRNLTVADIIESKKSGKKLTQVTAQNAEEAEIISDQNVDMIITGSDWFADVRSGARNTFITAALFAGRYITNEEILEQATLIINNAETLNMTWGTFKVDRLTTK